MSETAGSGHFAHRRFVGAAWPGVQVPGIHADGMAGAIRFALL
jgi:hypothetical protein